MTVERRCSSIGHSDRRGGDRVSEEVWLTEVEVSLSAN
jgi:hypothetical protein